MFIFIYIPSFVLPAKCAHNRSRWMSPGGNMPTCMW